MTPDLWKLRESLPTLGPIVERLELELIDDPSWGEPSDTSYLSDADRDNPDVAANVDAMAETNKLIAWFGRDADGYVGLWRGPNNRDLSASPVVRLDSEGQYSIVAATIADYLAIAMPEDEFASTRETLTRAGFKVGFNPDAIWGALDGFDDDPNAYRNELYEENRVKRGLTRSDAEAEEVGSNGESAEPIAVAVSEIESGATWVGEGVVSDSFSDEATQESEAVPVMDVPAKAAPVKKAAAKPAAKQAAAKKAPAKKPPAKKPAKKPPAKQAFAKKPPAKKAAAKTAAKKPAAKAKAKAKPAAKKKKR